MKLDLLVKIFLLITVFFAGGVLLASAAGYGFVSFETIKNVNTFVIWDNARVDGKGLDFANSANPIETGTLNIGTKDIYLKKFIGFGCGTNYAVSQECNTILGDAGGGTFIKAKKTTSGLNISSGTKGVDFVASSLSIANGITVNGGNLYVGSLPAAGVTGSGSVYASDLRADTMTVTNMPGLIFEKDAIFTPQAFLSYDLVK